MIAKFSPCSRRRCDILFTILTLLMCVVAVAVATDVDVAKPETLGRQLRGFRSLRTFVETTEDVRDSEERGPTDALKKVAVAAKNELALADQTTLSLFKSLQVEGAGEKLFRSKQFKEWAKTVTKNFNENTRRAEASLATALASHFGDEALVKLLATAKQNYKSRTVATQLETARMQAWETAGQTGDDIFKLLKLDDQGEKLFESPAAATWISYVTQLNKQNSDEVIFSSLKKLHNEEALAKMIAGPKTGVSTYLMATKLEKLQVNQWKSDGKSVDDIFALLKLNSQGEKFLQSPMLNTWIAYVKELGKNPYDLVLVKLSKYYDEAALAKVLVAAKQDDKTSGIARTLEGVQFKNWQSDGKSSDDIFKLLKLDKEGDGILESSMLKTWTSYLASLNKGNSDELMFIQLQKRYGEAGLVSMIATAKSSASTQSIAVKLQEELWRSQGKTADDVFDLLKLRNSGKNIFETAELSTWISYVTKLNKLNKKPDEFIVISELEKKFTGLELARMLADAKSQASLTDSAAETLAGKLQTLQFKKWQKQGETLTSISDELTAIVTVASDSKIVLAYANYLQPITATA